MNDFLFKTLEHNYLLQFTGGTTVADMNKPVIPDKILKFKPFAYIISRKCKKYLSIGQF